MVRTKWPAFGVIPALVMLMALCGQSMSTLTAQEETQATAAVAATSSTGALTLVVMDPLCDRLACDCVEGYAQRKYEVLGDYLAERLNRPVDVFWGESIQAALEEKNVQADIVVGKHSVVVHNAASMELPVTPVAQLTGSDGSVMQTGLIVVRTADPAATVSDLEGYRIFFGPEDCDEKYAAPRKMLLEAGIELPAAAEISGACSEAAMKLMELEEGTRAAAVISSYAEPLLSGCGTIEQGDLKVVGISDEVPFVTVFVNNGLSTGLNSAIVDALLAAGQDENVVAALETSDGFVAYEPFEDPTSGPESEPAAESEDGQKKTP